MGCFKDIPQEPQRYTISNYYASVDSSLFILVHQICWQEQKKGLKVYTRIYMNFYFFLKNDGFKLVHTYTMTSGVRMEPQERCKVPHKNI